MLYLLDDFLVVVLLFDDVYKVMERFLGILVFRIFGIFLSEKKIKGFCIELEYFGIILDFWNMEVYLLSEKIDYILFIDNFFKIRKLCIKRELFSLLGYFNFVCRVVLLG